ncbi:MAG: hypothetical protein IM631_13075 [Cytophagales bacterium]|jgi:hypothetical protein|nr:hypothetical protein [Cytophagales bacterium]MCA6372305.1 hypothetical protein [Cytophagales bacterium]MCA6382451.1 hypothetical protein [Cytophagales bacterium]
MADSISYQSTHLLIGLINAIPDRVCAWVDIEGAHSELSRVEQVFDLRQELSVLDRSLADRKLADGNYSNHFVASCLQSTLESVIRESVGCFPWAPDQLVDANKLRQSLLLVIPDKNEIVDRFYGGNRSRLLARNIV